MDQPKHPAPRLDAAFWSGRYQDAATGWDTGAASPALLHELEALLSTGAIGRNTPMLFPGAGRAYEAEALHRDGFREVHVLDWAAEALDALRERVPDFPRSGLHQQDFFAHQPWTGAGSDREGKGYGLLVEQTFFCAIAPQRRPEYVTHAARLLAPGALLVGLLFGVPLNDAGKGEGPPYGGDAASYRRLFEAHFDVEHLETADRSIAPRAGRELLIRARVRH